MGEREPFIAKQIINNNDGDTGWGTHLEEREHGLQKIAVKERIVLAEKHNTDDSIDVKDQQ